MGAAYFVLKENLITSLCGLKKNDSEIYEVANFSCDWGRWHGDRAAEVFKSNLILSISLNNTENC